MRYHQLLENENGLVSEILSTSKDVIDSGVVLYRGSENPPTTSGLYKVRKDRKPVDTDPLNHLMGNKYFNKKFGINARSDTLFVSPSRRIANGYGIIVGIIPKGKAVYIFSPEVKDLFVAYSKPLKFFGADISVDTFKTNYMKDLYDILERVSFRNIAKHLIRDFDSIDDITSDILDDYFNVYSMFMDQLNYKATSNILDLIPYTNEENNEIEIMMYCDEYYTILLDSPEGNKLDELGYHI